MKLLKKLIIGLIVIVLLVFVVTLFLPSNMHVQRSAEIEAPPAVVFNQVNELKNWENWSPWLKMDDKMEISYGDQTFGTGASYSWTSPNGTGTLTIKESVAGKSINNELDFGAQGIGYGTWMFEPTEKGTKVIWIFDSDTDSNPVKKLQALMMDKYVGNVMEEGLKGIENISVHVRKIEEKTVPGTDFSLTHKATCKMEDISSQLGTSYGMIMNVMLQDSAEMTSAPFCIYHKWDESTGIVELEAGFAINKKVESSGEVNSVAFPPTNTISAHYYGDYHGIGIAHEAIDTYISMNGKQVSGSPWEHYITDPGAEADTNKWQTVVYYPIN